MSTNIKVFQIYYKPEQLAYVDPGFEPLDNTSNLKPELREWYNWDQEHERRLEENLDLWGYVSWKFREKTNLTSQTVFDHIQNNPGYEVYLFNPCIVNEALFANSWEQGDNWHPGISGIGNDFYAKLGYKDIDVKHMLLDRTRTVFANYVIGNRRFWTEFMEFSRRLFTEADKDPEFKSRVFGEGGSQYNFDKSLPNFTFLIERLIPTFLDMGEYKVCPWIYDERTLPDKYRPYIGHIKSLSDLKCLINRYDSDELFEVWAYLRWDFLQRHQGILNLE